MYVDSKDLRKIARNIRINYENTIYVICLFTELLDCPHGKGNHINKDCQSTRNLSKPYHLKGD